LRARDLARNVGRVARREELAERLNALFRTRTRNEWLRLLAEVGIPAASVNSIGESLRHSQIQARGLVRTVQHPTIGAMQTVGIPIHFETSETATPTAPPLQGGDTEAVLRELGYSDEQIVQITAANARRK
jgi:crotonobetainyl-CoA:carnitine CoA-transferase CaiB-like acyl-CoA transferase